MIYNSILKHLNSESFEVNFCHFVMQLRIIFFVLLLEDGAEVLEREHARAVVNLVDDVVHLDLGGVHTCSSE